MGLVSLYLLAVVVVSIPVSLFECWGISHFNVGWGEPLPADTFWGKPAVVKIPWNLHDIRLATRYHAAMFLVVGPVTIVLCALAIKQFATDAPSGWLGWTMFIVASALGLMVLEDFLFFVFSSLFGSPYPHALARLLNGEANWHPRWINFGYFRLPDFYIWMPIVIAALLLLMPRTSS